MLLRVLEVGGAVLLIVLLFTQLVIPILRGKKLFPLFRRQGKLERELAEVTQDKDDEKLKSKIEKIRTKAWSPPKDPPAQPHTVEPKGNKDVDNA